VKKSSTVTRDDLAASIAERAGVSIAAVREILAQKKGKEPQAAAEKLAAAVPASQHDWLPLLASYLAGCSQDDADRLILAIRDVKAA